MVEKGNVAVVQRLIEDERVDPTVHNNICIQLASQAGNLIPTFFGSFSEYNTVLKIY